VEATEGVVGITPGNAAAVGARRMSWGGAMVAAFLAALARPPWWALALASFLLRGGVLAVLVPIVTLPTVATLSSLASPTLAAIAFGNPPPAMVATYALLGGFLALWVVLAVVFGAWLDLELIDEVTLDEDLGLPHRRMGVPLRRAVVVRLAAHAGTLVAATYAVVRLVVEGYGEILSPGEPATPLAWRIALRAPDAIVILVGVWLAGESLGGLAIRRVARGESILVALAWALRRLVRPSGLATLVVTNLGVAVGLLPLWLAGSRAWDQARVMLVDDAPTPLLVAALLLLVASWFLGLALLAAVLAWRSAAWTTEADRVTAPAARPTISSTVASA